MYAKELSEPKYQFLIKKREDIRIRHLNDPIAFIKYSSTMDDVYNNIDDYNSKRNRKKLIVFEINLLYSSHNPIFLFQKKLH